MQSPNDTLHLTQSLLEAEAPEVEHHTGVDRRDFVFLSLVSAAATTFGVRSAHALNNRHFQQQQPASPPLGNSEAPAEQFMPYPGGTGAILAKTYREAGAGAFERAVFKVDGFQGPIPTSDEDLAFLPAHRLSALIKARKLTSTRITGIYLERLKRYNPTLLCAVTIMESQGLAQAAQMDAELAAGKWRGSLHGLPYGVKDLFATKGVPTTWGAKDFESRIVDEDAEIVVRLRDAGAVLIAKLVTGLFANGDQWSRGRTNNPWNITQGSSGSSAEPASATAAACVAFAIGTETSGSLVSPAIRCGVSALRPTFGRVSRAGGMVLAWSQDRVGPIARTVEDAAMVFNAVHGADEKDSSTITMPFHFDSNVDLARLRVGVDAAGAPPEFVAKLKELGMNARSIGARPPTPAGVQAGGFNGEYSAAFDSYVQQKAKETGFDLNALVESPRGMGGVIGGSTTPTTANPMAGADWNPRFVLGRTVRAYDYINGQRRRLQMVQAWGAFMKDLDMFIANPNADVAPNALTGHPCVVVQSTFGVPQQQGGGTPVSAAVLHPQPVCAVIVGALYDDDKILSVAHQYQAHTNILNNRPRLP